MLFTVAARCSADEYETIPSNNRDGRNLHTLHEAIRSLRVSLLIASDTTSW